MEGLWARRRSADRRGSFLCVDAGAPGSNLEPPDPESGALPLSHAPAMPYGEAEFNAQRRALNRSVGPTAAYCLRASHRYATRLRVVGPFGSGCRGPAGRRCSWDSAVEVDAMAGSTATPPGTIGKDSITTIARTMANSYLLRGEQGFVMVDTGLPNRRADIDQRSRTPAAGWRSPTGRPYPRRLRPRRKRRAPRAIHGAKLAIHRDNAERVRRGDWSYGFKPQPDRSSSPSVSSGHLSSRDRSTRSSQTSISREARASARMGTTARSCTPGHTRGSVGVLTRDRDILCGDLLMNMLGGAPGVLHRRPRSRHRQRRAPPDARCADRLPGTRQAFDFAKLKVRR